MVDPREELARLIEPLVWDHLSADPRDRHRTSEALSIREKARRAADRILDAGWTPPAQTDPATQTALGVTEVCPACDIADCWHIRQRRRFEAWRWGAPAQTDAEPTAWLAVDGGGVRNCFETSAEDAWRWVRKYGSGTVIPLYARPAPAQTDEADAELFVMSDDEENLLTILAQDREKHLMSPEDQTAAWAKIEARIAENEPLIEAARARLAEMNAEAAQTDEARADRTAKALYEAVCAYEKKCGLMSNPTPWEQVTDTDREEARSIARAALAAAGPVVPEGWKLVPQDPTPDMRIKGGIAWVDALPEAETYVDTADACYKAMLSAAPDPS